MEKLHLSGLTRPAMLMHGGFFFVPPSDVFIVPSFSISEDARMIPFPSESPCTSPSGAKTFTVVFLALLLGITLLSAVPAHSQEDLSAAPQDKPIFQPPTASLELSGRHLVNSAVGNTQGELSVTQTRADVSWSRFSLGWHTDWYSWENRQNLPFGDGRTDPWKTLNVLTFLVRHRDQLSQRWSYFVQGAIRSGFERELSRSVGVAVNGGVVYGWNEDWTVGIGGFIGVDPTSKFAFSSTFAMGGPFVQFRHPGAPGISGRLGFPQSELRYTGSPVWSTWLGLSIDSDTYRLADDSSVMPKGYVRDRMITSGIYLDLTPAPALLLRLGPTYNFSRRLEFYDSGGGKRRSYDLEDALGFETKIGWTF